MIKKILNIACFNNVSKAKFFFSNKAGALNFYDLLEVKPGCSQKDIKISFARLAKLYHPDVYKGSDKTRFQKINEAYNTLKNVNKRREYDSDVLGLKNGVNFSENDENKKSENEQDGDKNEMYNFDGFQGKENENLSEEFNKFIQKPTEHPPDTVIVVEDPFLRQLNMEERIRYELKNYGNNADLYELKYGHQKGYRKSADDVVEILNERVQPEAVKEYKAKYVNQKINTLRSISIWIFWLLIVPVFIFAARKRALNKREVIQEMMKLDKAQIENETEELRSRIVFIGEENRKS